MPVTKFVKRLLSGRGNNLHNRVTELEKTVGRLQAMRNQDAADYLIKVEHIHVDKVIVERFDLSNNFANLGIKDLQGCMNIGAVYGAGATPPVNLKPDDGGENNEDAGGRERQESSGRPQVTITYGR